VPEEISQVLEFYNLPEIARNPVKHSNQSVSYQIHNWQNRKWVSGSSGSNNPLSLLYLNTQENPATMHINQPVPENKTVEERPQAP